ncbi:REST corepressor [Toxocara canis]|uniref:REST corepressor n=1 Tax=Toxocara canis TaxID=6265 RepID=A0A0B2UYF7_TOXCA|nr:REST corepressor [Toxocara canis]
MDEHRLTIFSSGAAIERCATFGVRVVMKYMSGSTVTPTVAAPRGYPVILMQRNAAIASSMMVDVLCQRSDISADGRENSSGCSTPPPVLDSGYSTPPPILDKYGSDDVNRKVAKRELPDVDSDMDTIEILPVQVASNDNMASVEVQSRSVNAPNAQSSMELKDGTNLKEVRRSQRITVQPHRVDGLFVTKGSHLAEASTDGASTSSLASKKAKTEEVGRIREGIDYQAEVQLCEEWKEPPESCREEEKDRDVCVWRDDHGRIESKELEEFYQVTRQQFAFDVANALEVIYRNNYDMARAMERVEEMVPPKEDPLTAEEQRLFLKSLNMHGKNFFRMQKMIPTRSVSSLVNHYYLTKKARCFGAVTDEPCPLLMKICDEENAIISRRECDNCSLANGRSQKRRKGRYCGICDLYFRKLKRPRPFTVPLKQPVEDHSGANPLESMASSSTKTTFKTQAHGGPHNCSFTTPHYSKIRQERAAEWTIEEELEALKGFRRFGKNFKAIAEMIKTKTPEMVRRFYDDKQSVFRIEYLTKLSTAIRFRRFGKNFKAIAEMIKTKTPEMVRRFYDDKQSVFRIEYLISSHSKLMKSEEHTSEGESSSGSRTAVRDNGSAAENGLSRRSQRASVWEPVVTRMTTRHTNGTTTSAHINEPTPSFSNP